MGDNFRVYGQSEMTKESKDDILSALPKELLEGEKVSQADLIKFAPVLAHQQALAYEKNATTFASKPASRTTNSKRCATTRRSSGKWGRRSRRKKRGESETETFSPPNKGPKSPPHSKRPKNEVLANSTNTKNVRFPILGTIFFLARFYCV